MAISPYVTGPGLIRVNLRDGNGLVDLGYTQDGIEWQYNTMWRDIHCDSTGGTDGPPADRQLMGASARIPIQLTCFESAVFIAMTKLIAGDGAAPSALLPGELPPAGCLAGAEGVSFQMVLVGEKDVVSLAADAPAGTGDAYVSSGAQVLSPVNFLNCFYDGPISTMLGSKNSMPSFDILALATRSVVASGGDGKQRVFVHRDQTVWNDLAAVSVTGTAP